MTSELRDKPETSEGASIPIIEERLEAGVENVETGRVTLSSNVVADERLVSERLARLSVRVERVPVDRMVDEAPAVRTEGDRTIVPVFEEVLVKRFRITEEVHLIRERSEETVEQRVTLRRNHVEVEHSASESLTTAEATNPVR